MPSYTNHPKAHWFDAARQLRQAAARITRAAENHPIKGIKDTESLRKRHLSEARALIDAALARIKDDE